MMLKCGHCGRLNAPGTRLCTRCRFVLRGNEELVEEPAPDVGQAPRRPAKRGLIYRMRHDRRTAAYAVLVVATVVAVSLAVYYELHKDDPSPSALLFYRYIPPTDTSGGMVQVYGDLHNWGGSGGTVFIEVWISDEDGNSASYVLDLGRVPPDASIDIDEMLDWPHYCESASDLDLTYKADYESDWWF